MSNPATTGLGVDDIIKDKRDAILRLVTQYGASNVRVFGSVARGDARADSDVDLLVSFPADKSVFELVGLWLELKRLIGRDVSLVADGIEDERFMKNALKDAVPL
jgi:predicted nucleotidyltransferase